MNDALAAAAAAQAAAAQAAAEQHAAAVQQHHAELQAAAEQHAAAAQAAAAAEQHQLAVQQLQQQHEAAAAAAAAVAAGHAFDPAALEQQQHQLGTVSLADPAQMAAAIAAGLLPGSLGMAQLLAPGVMSAQLLTQQGHGMEGLAEMPAQAPPQRPGSIQRGQEGYSRKAKSLSLLCENFVGQFGAVVNSVINLDNAAAQLGVERRRIYDIVNVLESIKVVSKLQKNQ